MKKLTIEQLKNFKESEDKVEFKRAEQGNFAYDGGSRVKPSDRRKCILGYVTALCNEGGGCLVIGMEDAYPHKVVGTKQSEGKLGELESISPPRSRNLSVSLRLRLRNHKEAGI